jgi:hypothetical protein
VDKWLYSNALEGGYSLFEIAPKPSKQLEWVKSVNNKYYIVWKLRNIVLFLCVVYLFYGMFKKRIL